MGSAEATTDKPGRDAAGGMPQTTGLSAETCVEAVDGPAAIAELAGKGVPILTRLPSGTLGFRILSKVTASAQPVPVVRIVLDNGHSAILAADQVIYTADQTAVRAADVKAADVLEASFHYPAGYRLRGADAESSEGGVAGFRVVAVEPAGEGIVYTGRVNETGCLFLTAGILCRLRGP